jgi:hypothetical protein
MYIGWDIHCKFSKVTFAEKRKDGQMRVVKRVRLEHDDQQAMAQWLLRIKPGIPVALDAAFGWSWVADLVEKCGLEPHLGHPPAIRELAKHAGRLHHKSFSEEDLFQVGVIPASDKVFVLHADLQRVVVLQQAQRRATEDAEVGVGMAKPHAGLILLERHIELPMQLVFDRPVAANRSSELLRRELLAQDVVAHLVAKFQIRGILPDVLVQREMESRSCGLTG